MKHQDELNLYKNVYFEIQPQRESIMAGTGPGNWGWKLKVVSSNLNHENEASSKQ